jgi:hypothetical protein
MRARSLMTPLFVALSLALAACGGSEPRPVYPEQRVPAGAPVSDDAFAQAVHDLLVTPPASRERALRLEGIIAKQMMRANGRFRARNPEAGITALGGGLYLLRTGELGDAVLGAAGPDAFRLASREFAKRGDEGRAEAAYRYLSKAAPEPHKSEAAGHLSAIDAWNKSTGNGAVATAGGLARAAASRYLYELTADARDAALLRTQEWLGQALALRDAFRKGRVPPNRNEGNEAIRAFANAPLLLVAIHLRNHDPAGAVTALSRGETAQLVRRDLLAAVSNLAEKPTAERWVEVAQMLRPQPPSPDEESGPEDLEIFRAASFAAAMEAYRLDPANPAAAIEVSLRLNEAGLSEAAPLALVSAIRANPDPRLLNAGVAISIASMETSVGLEEHDAVRRTFKAAVPLLEAARKSSRPIPTSPARAVALLGEVELRDGQLVEARVLLDAAERENPKLGLALSLARIDFHEGKTPQGIERLKAAIARDTTNDALHRGELWLALADAQQEARDKASARASLLEALREIKAAKTQGAAEVQQQRLLSAVYDRFGAFDLGSRALDRALDAANRNKGLFPSLIGGAVARAYTRGDLATARDALQRALASDVEPASLVYSALWVRLLERQLKQPADPAVERVLSQGTDDARWVGRVAAFGLGQLTGAALVEQAKNPAQRTEALFYLAAEKRIAQDASAQDALRQAIQAGGVELVEYAIAKDWLLDRARNNLGPIPPGER